MLADWEIVDSVGQVVFRGSQSQCEVWLDINENQGRLPVQLRRPAATLDGERRSTLAGGTANRPHGR